MVRPLVRWAIRTPHDHILDPAVGDGIFLAEAARLLQQGRGSRRSPQLHGFDVNPEAVAASARTIADVLGPAAAPDLRVADFFQIDPPTSLFGDLGYVDVVVGNPP
ncbi:MAG: N-6 DNA methylase [Armatimonadetes bacterium]|nr:N-6 DNA methylase [Armatimonadota bacterium]